MYNLGYNDLKILKLTDKYILKDRIAWIDQGSLLGLVRDGKFIEWDDDIDITCMYDKKPELSMSDLKLLLEHDYIVLTSKYDYTLKKLSLDKSLKKVDLTFIYKKKNKYYKSYSDYKNQNIIAKIFEKTIKESFQLLCKLKRPGPRLAGWMLVNSLTHFYRSYVMKTVDMLCPEWQFDLEMVPMHEGFSSICMYKQPEKYLEYKFGPDWKTPKREWDYTTEDGGLKSGVTDGQP